jgi:acetylornithine/succinyldiaminopimelate/putrescine aminotransferase
LACRAALFVLGEIFDGGVGDNVKRVGTVFEQRLKAMAAKHSFVKEVRGAGLMWGLELDREAGAVVPAALERGVIVNRTAEKVVRLLPPLVITEAEAGEALGRLDAALVAVGAGA